MIQFEQRAWNILATHILDVLKIIYNKHKSEEIWWNELNVLWGYIKKKKSLKKASFLG